MSILDDVDKTLKNGDNYMLNEKVDILIDTSKSTNECIAIALNDINNSLNTLINIFRNPEIKQVVIEEEYNDYMIFNRTFYHVNEENAKGFAVEGKVFEDKENGSFIVCGARFQHHATLHIAMMGGDYDKCLDFAVNYAKAQGLEKVSCTFAIDNPKLEQALIARGFASEPSDLITMEIKF